MYLITVKAPRPLQAWGTCMVVGPGTEGLGFLLRKTMAREERSRNKMCVLKDHQETYLEAGNGVNNEGEETPFIT